MRPRLSMASTAMAAMALPALVFAAAAVPRQLGSLPGPWITVDANGGAATVTPIVTTINSAPTTFSNPPSYLTQTSVYILSDGGHTTTSTGLAPVASATGTSQAGAFFACSNYQGVDSPFCLPRRGSQLFPGVTYYVTWDPSYFSSPNISVEVQAQYNDGAGGFSSSLMSAGQGFYIWSVDPSVLAAHQASTLNVTLLLAVINATTNAVSETPVFGPRVLVTNPATGVGTGPNVSPVAVAVPVVIGIVALGLMGFCVWSWRRHGRMPLLSALGSKRRSAQGYGVRQSHAQRTGRPGIGGDKGAGVGIQLTPSDSWSPTQGRNVFREELQRQSR